jgi:hypothetical protein
MNGCFSLACWSRFWQIAAIQSDVFDFAMRAFV